MRSASVIVAMTVVALVMFVCTASAQTWTEPLAITATDAVSGQSVSLNTGEAGRAEGAGLAIVAEAVQDQPGSGADRPPVRIMQISVTDTTGEDRAVDLRVALAADLVGWDWHEDINSFSPITLASLLTERQYPLVVVTPPIGNGVAMAIEPSQPVIYDLTADAQGLSLNARIGLTALGTDELGSAAHVRLYLYPVDGQIGFRDALANYYRIFPEAFERRAMDEGQWLFAFPNTELPNPAHYAYHEGGPTGWQYDEEHGIGTYPYTEVSSRTIHMHRLPTDRQDALAAFEEYQGNQQLAVAQWAPRGGVADPEVAHTGSRSLRCEKDDPQAWVGASQDVPVKQEAPEAITVSGWLRAEDVTGQPDRELSLYADVQLQSGEWEFGEIATFETGTHDWQQATHVIDLQQPVEMVRLHCLFRSGHTGTVWFDDISVTTASKPNENLVQNPGFEEAGVNQDVLAIEAYAVEAADGHPVFAIRTDVSADVPPATPMKLLRFTLNPNPYLPQAEGVELPPGPRAIERYVRMMEEIPALDGAYIDSVSAWATRQMDFRREHFPAARHNFSYDPESKRVVAPGRYYTYDFLNELGRALRPHDGHVFTNIHNTMDTFLLYAVSDVPGIESSITDHEHFSYIRSASYQKPAVLLNFLNLHGFDVREKHDIHWRMAVLYGLYPSIGRRCDEAYELYGDLYRRFMPSLMRISAAGWEPVTHTRTAPATIRTERFGQSASDGLFITALNESPEAYAGELVLDAQALGITAGMIAADTTTGRIVEMTVADGAARMPMPIAPHDVAVWQIGAPEAIAATAREEMAQITVDLRRAEAEMPDETAARVRDLRGRIIGMSDDAPAPLQRATVDELVALHNDATIEATTWTGETPGQALLRAMMLRSRAEAVDRGRVDLATSSGAVTGEQAVATLEVGGTAVRDAAFLLLDGESLRVIDSSFTWPTEGYGDGFVDLMAIGLDDTPGAMRQTYAFRPAVELTLEAADPSSPLAERILTARCHNNSSALRHMRMRIEGGDGDWSLTPAQWRELDVPPNTSMIEEFTVRAPDGVIRMEELKLVAEGEAGRFEATAVALCGGPAELENNLARAEGVQLNVDSSYSGYTPTTLNDGLLWPANVHWTQHAWASADTADDHWIELTWPAPVRLGRVIIYWNVEDAQVYAPREVRVEVERDGELMPLATAEPAPGDAATTVLLSPTETRRIRIVQPAAMGSVHRPNLMWVTEVQVGG